MYLSRSEACQRLKITETRLRQLEKQGKLVRIKASEVNHAPTNTRGGRRVTWVYSERQVDDLVGKTGADTRFARDHRTDAMVFDLLAAGVDLVDIVRRLRLDSPTVERLRDKYVKEKGGFVVTGEDVRAAKELGFDLTLKTFSTVLARLLDFVRGVKPAKDKLSRLKVVPDE